MITCLRINLDIKEEMKFNVNKASLFHGYLMEQVNEKFAEEMHISKLRPYSLYLTKENGQWYWVVNTLNKYGYENIIEILSLKKEIELKHGDLKIKIKDKNVRYTSFDEIFKNNYFKDNISHYISIEFITPTAFKSDGKYINYPTTQLLFSSLINKYDTSSTTTNIYDEQLIKELLNNVEISKYNLRSSYFHLEGIKIPAFLGKIEIKISGNKNLVSFANMLFNFGEYSGVGIKNAIGMGGIKILEKYF